MGQPSEVKVSTTATGADPSDLIRAAKGGSGLLQRVKCGLAVRPCDAPPGHKPRRAENRFRTEARAPVHGVAVPVVKRQRPSERPGTEEQIKCSTFVCHNVIRPREVTGTLTLPDRVDVADVTPRESSPARKPTWCVIICETARGGESIRQKADSRLPVGAGRQVGAWLLRESPPASRVTKMLRELGGAAAARHRDCTRRL